LSTPDNSIGYLLPAAPRVFLIAGAGGDYKLEWDGAPEVVLDLEIKPRGVSVYARLTLADRQAGLEIDHISFQEPFDNPDDNTAFLAKSLQEARFVKTDAFSM